MKTLSDKLIKNNQRGSQGMFYSVYGIFQILVVPDKLAQCSNAFLCEKLALSVDQVTIQLKNLMGLPHRVGILRNVEVLVCEQSFSIMDLN